MSDNIRYIPYLKRIVEDQIFIFDGMFQRPHRFLACVFKESDIYPKGMEEEKKIIHRKWCTIEKVKLTFLEGHTYRLYLRDPLGDLSWDPTFMIHYDKSIVECKYTLYRKSEDVLPLNISDVEFHI